MVAATLLALGAGTVLVPGARAASLPALVRPALLAPPGVPTGSAALGSVPTGQQLQLQVALAPSNPAQLRSTLHDLYDPGSPRYHQWLGPGQFLARFGPSSAEVAAVESWLHGDGLTRTSVSGFAVRVSAPAGLVTAALGTALDRYRAPSGRVGYLARQAPLVPRSLGSGQIAAIFGLDTLSAFEPHSTLTPAPPAPGAQNGNANGLQPNATGPLPNATGPHACGSALAAAGSSAYTLDALGAAYGVGSLLAAGQDGQGETIGVYELSPYSPSDVAVYESCFVLSVPVGSVTVDGGGTKSTAGTAEADLDIEQAATQAPGASVLSYEGPNSATGAYDTWATMVNADAAQVLSTSWGECEPSAVGDGTIGAYTLLFEQAATQGQTVLAASGDSGSEDCYRYPGDTSTAVAVDYPASDPWVTAAGGTARSLQGAEAVWNDCQGKAASCANGLSVGAGGGGMSREEPRPSDQPNALTWSTAQPCGVTCREVPDLSANAGTAMVLYAGGWWLGLGTSFVAPFLAGIVADRNGGCTGATGMWAPALYAMASQGGYGTAFTDVTSGNTDFTDTYGGQYYPALTGYDAATGLGSPLATGLACPEVASVGQGSGGSTVTVSGLALEHATISFGGAPAQIVSAGATSATVVVPAGNGTVTVSATSVLGSGTVTSSFTYPSPPPPPQGYWLVGADGGIFTFGSAQFYGSTGGLVLQRPVVGVTPTADRGGYWLVASDGGIFAFGDSGFHGSIPGLGIAPAGTPGVPRALSAPIVGMVPSADGGGYFMVGSDGGVFAFGDARFAGSCPGIGGCSGRAVAVLPDATGNGYWVVTGTGHVYAFGDAAYDGAPGPRAVPVTSAARTPDGGGYWILFADGTVSGYGDAKAFGGPVGSASALDPATAVFATSDGQGYWVATATGAVYPYGDAPDDGSMAGHALNAPIIAATGW